MSGVSLNGKRKKLELDLKEVLDLVGYQFLLKEGKVRSSLEHWQTLNANPETSLRTHMPSPTGDASERVTDSHRQASPPRLPQHEADTEALEEQLVGTRITRKGDPHSQFTPPPSKMVDVG